MPRKYAMHRTAITSVITALSLSLSACGGGEKAELDQLDTKLGAKVDADPALTAALEGQIMVDPELAGQANEDSIRGPNQPFQAPIPQGEGGAGGQTLGALAAQQANAAQAKFTGCSLDVNYSFQWSNRLPAELPLPAKAKVVEAAGSDRQGCALRVVSYSAPLEPRALTSYYLGLARRGGYVPANAVDGKGTMVSGTRASDGAAFYAIVQPANGGASVDVVTNRGS
jgi:hypothetical protein